MGVALFSLHSGTFVKAGVLRTKKADKKRKVRAADDNTARVVELMDQLHRFVDNIIPVVVCAESLSTPRNSSAAIKTGLSWGATVQAARSWRAPVLQETPQFIKKALVGSNSASKQQVATAIVQCYGATMSGLLKHITPSQREHGWDAMAAVHACLQDPMVALVRAGHER